MPSLAVLYRMLGRYRSSVVRACVRRERVYPSSVLNAMARSPAAPLLLLLGVGCGTHNLCSGSCSVNRSATFVLSCSTTDLTSVAVSGPCASGHAGTSLEIESPSPGVCHVALTFATGFVYSADVTFVSQTDPEPAGCATCPPYITATQRTFMVDNPPATCIAAGTDAGRDAPIGD